MKFTKMFAVSLLVLASMLTPTKKAEAGFIIGSPAVALSAMAVGLAVWVPAYARQESGVYGTFDRVAPAIFLTAWAVGVLDDNQDALKAELEKTFPSLPAYVISEATLALKDKAAGIQANAEGIKTVHLSAEEFADLANVIPSGASSSDVEGFKTLMTTPIAL